MIEPNRRFRYKNIPVENDLTDQNLINNTNLEIQIIIARYQENIDWIQEIVSLPFVSKIHIFNKFYPKSSNMNFTSTDDKIIYYELPNIGRESHTYLSFIVNNYNYIINSNNFYIFLQAEPFFHCKNISTTISNIKKYDLTEIFPFNGVVKENEDSPFRKCDTHPHGLFIAYFMQKLFDLQLDEKQTIDVNYGAQFGVSSKTIRQRPVDFYKYLLKLVSNEKNSIEPYIFERLWLYIFNSKLLISNIYKIWT